MKAIKIYIHRPTNCTWKELSNQFHDLQYQTAKSLNHCMSEWFLFQRIKEQIKTETGKYPTAKELPTPEKRLYHELRAMFPEMYSRSISEITRRAKLRWQTDCKDVYYRMEKSLPSYRKNIGLFATSQQYKQVVKDQSNNYYITVSLRSTAFDGLRRFELRLKTQKINTAHKLILDKMVSGDYKASAIQIKKDRKGKWFIIFTYEPEKKDHELEPEKVVGIDIGIATAVFACVSGSPDYLRIQGGEIEPYRKRTMEQRKQKQNQYPVSGRKNHGRVTALKPVSLIEDREARFKDTVNHRYSKAIIDFALKHRAGTIQMENLSSLKEKKQAAEKGDKDYFLKNWPIYDLQKKVEYKAEHEGIKVIYVNPRYTSQRCFRCGAIGSSRPKQHIFICNVCGYGDDFLFLTMVTTVL